MLEKIIKFAQRVNEMVPELSVDALLAMWEETDQDQEVSTCKHMFLKGKNANTQCKMKVKGDVKYCSKHKKGE
jgi:hypothetical protein